jgi:DNA-binding FadR family transcriptional regulator
MMASKPSLGTKGGQRRPPVEFDRIRQVRAHEYVAEQIRRHIALRLVAPGEALPPERELARMFGVGRPTVQRALRGLEANHLVEARRGRLGGTFVLTPSDDAEVMEEQLTRLLRRSAELEELLEYRCLLEPLTARVAAGSRGEDDLAKIEQALASLALPLEEAEYMRFDTEFHIAVAAATHNRYLTNGIVEIRTELNDALALLPETDAWHSRLSHEHRQIYAAIESSDPDGAEAAARLHVTNSNRSIGAVMTAVQRRRAAGAT